MSSALGKDPNAESKMDDDDPFGGKNGDNIHMVDDDGIDDEIHDDLMDDIDDELKFD